MADGVSYSDEIGIDYELQDLRLQFLATVDLLYPVARTELYSIWKRNLSGFDQVVRVLRTEKDEPEAGKKNQSPDFVTGRALVQYDPDSRVSILRPLLDTLRGLYPHPVTTTVCSEVNEWACKHKMDCDWVRDAACRMIAEWDNQEPAGSNRDIPWIVPPTKASQTGIASNPLPWNKSQFCFVVEDAWHPYIGSVEAAKKTVQAKFDEYFKEWFKERVALADQRGWSKVSRRRR